MKYLHYLAAIIALGLMAFRAQARVGPLSISLTATQQSLQQQSTYSTNTTATTTNVTVVTRSTKTNLVITSKTLVRMLTNSFNTTLPSDAVLKLSESGHIVVAVGTNIVLDVNSVLHFAFNANMQIESGTGTNVYRYRPTGDSATLQQVFTTTSVDSLVYDDSGLSTGNGKVTNFKVQGLNTLHMNQVASSNGSAETSTTTYTLTLTGQGDGVIADKPSVVKGFATGSVTTNAIN